MTSRSYNGQFITTDFRLLDDPSYCRFMRSAAFATYMMLRRYVWRGTAKSHPIPQVNDLFRRGFLVAAVPRPVVADKLGLSGLPTVTRHIAELDELGVLEKVPTGRENVYVLGTWEDRSRARDGRFVVETFYLDQVFGPESYEPPRPDDLPPGFTGGDYASEVSPMRSSEVSPMRSSEVSRMKPINKEANREAKREEGARLAPLAGEERPHGVIYVEY